MPTSRLTAATLPIMLAFVILVPVVRGAEAGDIWPMEEGSVVVFRTDDGWETSLDRTTSVRRTEQGVVQEIVATAWDRELHQFRHAFLKDVHGDIRLLEMEDMGTGLVIRYEPPLLLLDVPLEAGKTWQSEVRRFDSRYPQGPGEIERHVFGVEETDVETPVGTFRVFQTSDDPTGGPSFGGLYVHPGLGLVAYEENSDGKLRRMAGRSGDGGELLPGWGEEIDFAFAWQPGMAWQVERTADARDKRGPEGKYVGGSARFDMTVEMLPTDLMIRRDGMIPIGLPAGEEPSAQERRLLDMMSRFRIRHVVGRDGSFRALANRDAHQKATRELLDVCVGMDAPAELQPVMSRLAAAAQALDADVLEAELAHQWDALIGIWAGRTLRVGEVVRLTGTLPLAPAAGDGFAATALMMVTGRCPCDDGDASLDCVEAVATDYVYEGDNAAYVYATKSVKIVTDPDGMFPRAAWVSRFIDATNDPELGDLFLATRESTTFTPVAVAPD